MENIKPGQCYERCNERYTAMQPERLFCKKGCDFDQDLYCMEYADKHAELKAAIKFVLRKSKEIRNCGLNFCIGLLEILLLAQSPVYTDVIQGHQRNDELTNLDFVFKNQNKSLFLSVSQGQN